MSRQLSPPEAASSERERAARWCVELDQVTKHYGSARQPVPALAGVTLAIPRGAFTAVMGPSGSGKSTLLHCAASTDRPTSGRVRLSGMELAALREPQLTQLRRERIGFVFQAFNLIGSLNVQDNVLLPLRLAGRRPDRAWLREVIAQVGLADRLRHRPGQLSGGQQQRVAIARALVSRPDVIFADEPTGALDAPNGQAVLELLRASVDRLGQSVVMVTHDPVAAGYADSVVFLADGRLADQLYRPGAAQIADRMASLRAGSVAR